MSAKVSASGNEFPPARPPSVRFGKSKRLLKHADFQRVYQNGRRQFTGNMTVFFLRRQSEADSGPRVGFTVGKVLGGAVERNRIKRRMRKRYGFRRRRALGRWTLCSIRARAFWSCRSRSC